MKIVDFDRPSVEIALDLIKESTGYQVPSNKIVLGAPQPLDVRPDVTTDENTFVPVQIEPTYDSRFEGTNGFLYKRLSLSILTPDPSVEITLPAYPFETKDILAGLNAMLHTQLTVDDIVNERYYTPRAAIQLKANPKSWVWIDAVPVTISDFVEEPEPEGGRLTEDGQLRITEDGFVRVPEDAF